MLSYNSKASPYKERQTWAFFTLDQWNVYLCQVLRLKYILVTDNHIWYTSYLCKNYKGSNFATYKAKFDRVVRFNLLNV